MKPVLWGLLAGAIAFPVLAEEPPKLSITSPTTGQIGVPGADIKILVNAPSTYNSVHVMGECLSKGLGSATNQGNNTWIWQGTVADSFGGEGICQISATGNPTADPMKPSEDAKAVYLLPKRTGTFMNLEIRSQLILQCEPSDLDIHAARRPDNGREAERVNVTYDPEIKVEFSDPLMAQYLGHGSLLGKKAGKVTVKVSYTTPDGSILNAQGQIEIAPAEGTSPHCGG